LKDFGEERSYAAEGGRTTRSTRPAAERLVVVLNEITELGVATKVERSAIARTLQKWLFEVGVLPYFNRQKIEVDISIQKPGPQIVADILDMKPNCTRRTIIVSEPTVPTYQPGDYVKVEFPDEATGIGEWMWMRVSRCDDLKQLVFGMLDNEPLGNL